MISAYSFTPKGAFSKEVIERETLLQNFKIHSRELRPILGIRQVSTILRRGSAIILNVYKLKIILNKDQALLFDDEIGKTQKAHKFFETKIKAYKGKMPFELYIIEAAFVFSFDEVKNSFQESEKVAKKVFARLSDEPTNEALEHLLLLKKEVTSLRAQITELETLLVEYLSEEEIPDLSFKSTPTQKDLDEIESVIESLAEQAERISFQIQQLEEDIEDQQDILTLKISNRRNNIIKLDLVISFVTTVFSFLAVIVGLFGMNIPNNLEDSHKAFLVVLFVLFLTISLSIGFMVKYFRKNRIL